MNDMSLDELVAAANPIDSVAVNELDLDPARDELMYRVMSTDAKPVLPERPSRPPRSRWRLRGLGIAAVAVCAIAAAILLTGGSGSDPTSTDSAWAAEQVRFAEASPLVLLDLPGWKVGYANEETKVDGEMDFVPPGEKYDPLGLRETTLHWREGPLSGWVEDRGSDPTVKQFTAPVLDTTARVFSSTDSSLDGEHLMRALWQQDGRVLEFESVVPDRQTYEDQLGGLVKVDVDQWLSALPKRSIPVADSLSVAEDMLKGIPLPPGFDPADIKVGELTKDRYYVGVVVFRTVACSWLDRWATALARGEEGKAQRATDAMTTAKGWPLVREIADLDVPHSWVLMVGTAMREYDPAASGQFESGMNCAELGIDLNIP